jgi:hypothetical protein
VEAGAPPQRLPPAQTMPTAAAYPVAPMYLHMFTGMSPQAYGYMPGRLPWTPPYHPRANFLVETPPHATSSAHTIDENHEVFPRIAEFLAELDKGPLGLDGHQFESYMSDFAREKVYRISELNGMTSEELRLICPSIPLGTARLILTKAAQDVKKVQKEFHRQQRLALHSPRQFF